MIRRKFYFPLSITSNTNTQQQQQQKRANLANELKLFMPNIGATHRIYDGMQLCTTFRKDPIPLILIIALQAIQPCWLVVTHVPNYVEGVRLSPHGALIFQKIYNNRYLSLYSWEQIFEAILDTPSRFQIIRICRL